MSSRRQRKAKRKLRAELAEERARFEAALAGAPIEMQMSFEQALDLARTGMSKVRREMTRRGGARREAWGLALDPHVLLVSCRSHLKMAERGFEMLDEINEDTATEQAMFDMFNLQAAGLIGLAACALLLLQSSPIPYDMCRHFVAVPNERHASKGGNDGPTTSGGA